MMLVKEVVPNKHSLEDRVVFKRCQFSNLSGILAMNCTLSSDQIFQMCYKPTLETFANVHAEQMFVFVNQLFLLIPFLGHTVH